MNHVSWLWKSVSRHKLRLAMMILAVFSAFVIFGIGRALTQTFSQDFAPQEHERMLAFHKRSISEPLPLSYVSRLASISGVAVASHGTWFEGYFRDKRNPVATYAVDAATYLGTYPELVIAPDQVAAWQADRTGLLVGEYYAQRHGWKVGDQIPLSSAIWLRSDRSNAWNLTVRGIFTGNSPDVQTNYVLMHYPALNEMRVSLRDTVGWLVFTAVDPRGGTALADAVDAAFANSFAETHSMPEREFLKAFSSQLGDIGAIVAAVLVAAFIMVIMVIGNTFAVAVRERRREIAVMQAIGFSVPHLFWLLLAEAALTLIPAGLLGLAAAAWMMGYLGTVISFLPPLTLTLQTVVLGVAILAGLALLVTSLPALRVARTRIIDGLANR